MLVKNGLEAEFFLDSMIENAENTELAVIDSSEGIATLASAGDHDHEHAESHGKESHDDHDEAHDDEEHGHEEHGDKEHGDEKHDHAAHGDEDPHIWLDPKRVVEQVENIRDGLIAADPDGEAEYIANADAFITDLAALDADIEETLSPFEGETFVVFHNFAAYFADSYDLQFEALVGVPEENPSPEDVKRVIETVRAEGLKTVLAEPQVEGTSFKTLAEDLDISVSSFNPMETGDSEATQPSYYLDTMRQNAESLAAGFEGVN